MFASKDSAYPSFSPFRCSTLGLAPGLICKHLTRLERPDSYKHSSLIRAFVNYGRIKFYNTELEEKWRIFTNTLAYYNSALIYCPRFFPADSKSTSEISVVVKASLRTSFHRLFSSIGRPFVKEVFWFEVAHPHLKKLFPEISSLAPGADDINLYFSTFLIIRISILGIRLSINYSVLNETKWYE
jgi:hypothetical protein